MNRSTASYFAPMVVAFALAGVAAAQDGEPDEAADPPSEGHSEAPKDQLPGAKPLKTYADIKWPVRDREDWSFMADLPKEAKTDFWDPVKYVKLSDDGKIWASFGGSLRLRLESWWNFEFNPSPQGDDTFLLTNLLAHGDFHFGENVRLFVQFKSAFSTDRTLPGGKRPLDVDTFAVQELFLDLRVPLDDAGSSLTIRPGRQMYLYGAQRLVSPLAWANTFRTWDGVTAILEFGDWRIDGFASYFVPVRKYEYNKPNRDIVFSGAYATGRLDRVGTDFYFLGLNRETAQTFNGTTGPEERYTLGVRAHGVVPDTTFDYDTEFAYQFGRVGAGNVSAYMLGGQFGYTFAGAWATPRLYGGLEMGSGDRNPGGGVQTFNELFPLGHAWLGYADLVARQNIIAPNLGVQIKPIPKLTIGLNGLAFWRHSTNDALYGIGGKVLRSAIPPFASNQTSFSSARSVGQEIDLTFVYKFDRHTTAVLGYSHFFAGDFIEETGTSPDVDFLYFSFLYAF